MPGLRCPERFRSLSRSYSESNDPIRMPAQERVMFHYRHPPDLSTIERRLRAIEGDLERYGRKAGRRASSGLSTAGEQIGDALSPI
jgi:hypothetical protein